MADWKLASEHLVPGLYVSELEVPWVQTDFLMQGFILRNREDVQRVRAVSRFVHIDEELSDFKALSRVRALMARPVGPKRPGILDILNQETSRRPRRPPPPAPRIARRALSAINQGDRLRDDMVDSMNALFHDIRQGRGNPVARATQFMGELIDYVDTRGDSAAWMKKLEQKEEFTALHCVSTSIIALQFAQHLRLPRNDIHEIGLGALLHDIGKIRTPREIIVKPGALNPAEWRKMRAHPHDGHDLARSRGTIPDKAQQAIRHHHERLGGHGYPERRRYNEIPDAAFIVALADVYDSLTSVRPYRNALLPEDALDVIYRSIDRDFPEDLVLEFIRAIGIYPVGTVVELMNNDIGVVVDTDLRHRLAPRVLLLPRKRGRSTARCVDAAHHDVVEDIPGHGNPTYAIRRVVARGGSGVGDGVVRSLLDQVSKRRDMSETKIDRMRSIFTSRLAEYGDDDDTERPRRSVGSP